jgi:hypothetical protein
MHPILHAWMILQSMPNFQVRLFAWYIVGGKQLSTGIMNLCRRDKSSSKNLLEQPWVVQMFNKINVADNFECRAPKFLVDPLKGPSMRQCGSGWNLGHDPDFQH